MSKMYYEKIIMKMYKIKNGTFFRWTDIFFFFKVSRYNHPKDVVKKINLDIIIIIRVCVTQVYTSKV